MQSDSFFIGKDINALAFIEIEFVRLYVVLRNFIGSVRMPMFTVHTFPKSESDALTLFNTECDKSPPQPLAPSILM